MLAGRVLDALMAMQRRSWEQGVAARALAGRGDLALAQVEGHRQRLHDERSCLYAASWDEETGTLLRAEHWGTGSGWVVAGIARALRTGLGWLGGACSPRRAGVSKSMAW